MKYYIQRDLNQYGPYTLADLQRYVAQGNILLTDLTKSEGMSEWVPVSQVIGNIPIQAPAPVYAPSAGTVYGGAGTVYGPGPGYAGAVTPVLSGPVPPDFHWALVLLIGFFTCTLFLYAWLIVEAAWVRKIKPSSPAIFFVCTGTAMIFVSGFMGGIRNVETNPMGGLLWIVGVVLNLIGIFQMRSDLEDYYNFQENISLNLSGVMTFFFAVFYFQHHFSRIAKWKKTGVLDPQG